MKEKTFTIKWDEELGEGWMNIFNLELCLFSKECIGGKARDAVKVEEITKPAITLRRLKNERVSDILKNGSPWSIAKAAEDSIKQQLEEQGYEVKE